MSNYFFRIQILWISYFAQNKYKNKHNMYVDIFYFPNLPLPSALHTLKRYKQHSILFIKDLAAV